MKVLVAEDDITSRAILQAILQKWGYEVIITCDGNEAWKALQENDAPQIALIDWEMPEIDGTALCRKLRAQERKYPLYLILLTSKDEREDIVQGLEAGADDYITKPYDNQELRARVNVGQRMIKLRNELRERDVLKGVLEMAGAVCHELNQPLQSVSGFSELLLLDMDNGDPNYETLKKIKAGVERIGKLTHKIMGISKYRAKEYMNGKRTIVDIDKSAESDQ